MSVLDTYAAFGAGFAVRPLTPDLRRHALRAVIDWYAALLPGAVMPPATLLERALAEELGRGRARLALGRAAGARAAALVNGTAAHSAEVDDIFRDAIYHPGAPVVAACLAAAEDTDASGEAFLRAVVVGYEISTRIGAVMGRGHYRFWHSTGTIGTFGAAAGAGVLYGLDATQLAHALATAATFAAALQQAFRSDSMSKPLHAGRAAEGGLLAALGAREGVTGALDVLEGDLGFASAMGGGADWQRGLDTLGQDFHIGRMTIKNHACCGHTFAAIDGALAARAALGVAADAVESVRVESYGEALHVAGNPTPSTAAEARFSLPYVVATALRFGSVRLAAFEPARLQDPATRVLMRRITLVVDAEIDARFPHARAARVTLTTTDGRTHTVHQPTRKGDPDMPLTDAELDDKFLELAGPVLGADVARTRLDRLWTLDTLRVRDLH
jgi:2-methylcitrate dehydratase PrpD